MTEPTEGTHRLYVYLDVMRGCYRWVLRSASGEAVTRSSKSYLQKALCLCDVESIKQSYPKVVVRDLTVGARPPTDNGGACA